MQQDAKLHSLLHLETALHVSVGTSTHYQERIQLYLQHLVFVAPLQLPAASGILLDKYWNILKMLGLDSCVQNEIKWEIGKEMKSVCAANLRHCASL
jgi:hypothetical protein